MLRIQMNNISYEVQDEDNKLMSWQAISHEKEGWRLLDIDESEGVYK